MQREPLKCTCVTRVMCPFCSARFLVDMALSEFEEDTEWTQLHSPE